MICAIQLQLTKVHGPKRSVLSILLNAAESSISLDKFVYIAINPWQPVL